MICQENMVCVHFYTYLFYHGYILRDLSHQLLVTGSQLFIFQEHYHLLPFIYLPYIMVGTGSSVFSSLPNPSVICCPAPGITSPVGFVWEEEELLEVFPPSPRDVQKDTKTDISFSLMSQPCGRKFTSVCQVLLGNVQRK